MSLKNLKTALGKLRALLATGLTLFAFTAAAENATKVWTTNQINSARVELKSFTIARVANDYTRIMAAHDVDHQALLRRLSALENRQGSPVSTTTLDALENRLSVKIQGNRERLSDTRRDVRDLKGKVGDEYAFTLSKNNWTIERHELVGNDCLHDTHHTHYPVARWWVHNRTKVWLLSICVKELWDGNDGKFRVGVMPGMRSSGNLILDGGNAVRKYAQCNLQSCASVQNPNSDRAWLTSSQLQAALSYLLDREVW